MKIIFTVGRQTANKCILRKLSLEIVKKTMKVCNRNIQTSLQERGLGTAYLKN